MKTEDFIVELTEKCAFTQTGPKTTEEEILSFFKSKDLLIDTCAELHLLLMFLMGWETEIEGKPGSKLYNCWQEFAYVIIEYLEEKGFIFHDLYNKRVFFTAEGKIEAEKLLKKYSCWALQK